MSDSDSEYQPVAGSESVTDSEAVGVPAKRMRQSEEHQQTTGAFKSCIAAHKFSRTYKNVTPNLFLFFFTDDLLNLIVDQLKFYTSQFIATTKIFALMSPLSMSPEG